MDASQIISLTADQVIKPEGPDAPALKKSIDAGQMWERPVVRPNGGGMYEVVWGRKRVLATLFNGGYGSIEVEVRHDLDDEDVATANLASNHSHTLNMRVDPWHVKLLLEGDPELGIEGRTQQDLAGQTGMSQAKISQLYGVFSLHPGLVSKVKAGLMGLGAVRLAHRLTEDEQVALAEQDGKITAPDVNRLLEARKQAVVKEVSSSQLPVVSSTENWQLQTDNDLLRGGLVIAGEKLDMLLTGAAVEINIDGQKLLLQIIGEADE